MHRHNKNQNKNSFNGIMNFNDTAQIAAGDIINNIPAVKSYQEAKYTPEPIWRSSITMAILTWVGFAISIVGLLPLGKIIKSILEFFNGNAKVLLKSEIMTYLIVLLVVLVLCFIIFSLRRITKTQTRYPLFINFAINGKGEKLTLEKIHIDKCLQCGGKMKYYNKPIEWREIFRNDGSLKREVTKRIPALECKRNTEHWYEVDPAEDKVD
ncbi:hypothetical protein [Scatolibacter rhodanostii]|uniref:hypothetical protein n=1 Tax=Scatolibacter rhodanostii TaxID=2014781 RepID=UPI000C07C79F|nr:hypothetical protein [Scatolibacter rhodanostii]